MTDDHHPDDLDLADSDALDKVLDGGFAAGDDEPPAPHDSVLDHIERAAGSRPRVALRDGEPAGRTPMLKPIGPDDARSMGKYTVHGELGRGGVGAVHRGHDQDLGRDVAVKFLHEKFKKTPAVLHRFVEEAQIGGQLQHPGIVPVYDLGMYGGKPFFTMKLVKGETLAKKLANRETVTSDRRALLSIFEDVCQTMAYAHARGVVHRDLKPANIMIGSFGEVQVVDWGMGKVLQSGGIADEKYAATQQSRLSVIETVRSEGHGTQSVMGSVMGTPAYMPPEQARGDVDAMDERSDVFALGAILCEILTGQPPYVGEAGELIGMAAMAELDDANRRLEACGAERDLVDLALRCLMPAPAARPQSAGKVAESIHAFLAGLEERVQAARVEAAEANVRAAALKRTQRLGIALTSTIAAGLVVSLWLWRDATEQREAAEEQRRIATARADDLHKVTNFQANLFGAIVPEWMGAHLRESIIAAAPEDQRAELQIILRHVNFTDIGLASMRHNVFDPASIAIDEHFADQPLVRAQLLQSMAQTLRSLGLFQAANRPQEMAVAIRREQLGNDAPDTLESIRAFGALQRVLGKGSSAELLLREAYEGMRRTLGEEDPGTLSALNSLAVVLESNGDTEAGHKLFQRRLGICRRVFGEEHPETVLTQSNLITSLTVQHRYAEAQSLGKAALAAHRRILGDETEETVNTLVAVGHAYDQAGLHEEAEAYFSEALETRRRTLGDDHPRTLGSYRALAANLRKQRKITQAKSLLLTALQGERRVLGEDHPLTLNTVNSLGAVLMDQGEFEEAVEMLEGCIEGLRSSPIADPSPRILAEKNLVAALVQLRRYTDAEPRLVELLASSRKLLGDQDLVTLLLMVDLGSLRAKQGKRQEAEAHLRAAIPGLEDVGGKEHRHTLLAKSALADLLAELGRIDESVRLHRSVIAAFARTQGEHSSDRLTAMRGLALLLRRANRLTEAEAIGREMLAGLRKALGEDHPDTLSALRNRGRVLEALGRREEAERIYRNALERCRHALGSGHHETARAMHALATLLMNRGNTQEAEPLFRESVKVRRQLERITSPSTLNAIHSHGFCLQLMDRQKEAEACFREALAGRRRLLGLESLATRSSMFNVGFTLNKQGKYEEALPFFLEVLEIERRILGDDHPKMLDRIASVAIQARHGGDLARAVHGFEEVLPKLERLAGREHDKTIRARLGLGKTRLLQANWTDAERLFLDVERSTAAGKGTEYRADVLDSLVELYEAWHQAVPGEGYGAKAQVWKAARR